GDLADAGLDWYQADQLTVQLLEHLLHMQVAHERLEVDFLIRLRVARISVAFRCGHDLQTGLGGCFHFFAEKKWDEELSRFLKTSSAATAGSVRPRAVSLR